MTGVPRDDGSRYADYLDTGRYQLRDDIIWRAHAGVTQPPEQVVRAAVSVQLADLTARMRAELAHAQVQRSWRQLQHAVAREVAAAVRQA
jgi:hypothetical protein